MRTAAEATASITTNDLTDELVLKLEQENRWLKRYLGETLKELHLLQAHLFGGAVH